MTRKSAWVAALFAIPLSLFPQSDSSDLPKSEVLTEETLPQEEGLCMQFRYKPMQQNASPDMEMAAAPETPVYNGPTILEINGSEEDISMQASQPVEERDSPVVSKEEVEDISLLATQSIETETPPEASRLVDVVISGEVSRPVNGESSSKNTCSWDVYTTGSFTYWQPIQDNMSPGLIETFLPNSEGESYKKINAHFGYEPGFEVGLGMRFDDDQWGTYLQYTWFRGSQKTETNLVENPNLNVIDPLWNLDSAFFSAKETWVLHMDLLDWEVARSYYITPNISLRPFFAVRAAWIRQNVQLVYSNPVLSGTNETSQTNKSYSWGVGPNIGLHSLWEIGKGFSFYGKGNLDLLFTQYTRLRFKQTPAVFGHQEETLIRQNNLNCLRPHVGLELGFGWGRDSCCQRRHMDISAGYGFQAFFDQNMLNLGFDLVKNASINPNGNLYVQGLTVRVSFDF